jgi:hypothetical protein
MQVHSNNVSFEFIDKYMDLLFVCGSAATGEERLQAQATCKQMEQRVTEELTRALLEGDSRAPSRVCYFVAAECAGSIRVKSPLGQAWVRGVGAGMKPFKSRRGLIFMSADFYWWWQAHRNEYPSLHVFEQWCQLDWTKKMVIPLFQSLKSEQ